MRRSPAFLVPLAALAALAAVGGAAAVADRGPLEQTPSAASPAHGESAARLDRLTQRTETAVSTLRPDVVLVADPTLPKDQLALRQEGVAGQVRTTVRITALDGTVIDAEVVGDDVVRPISRVVAVGTMEEPPPGVWDRLAQCESNGNWSISTGNGYYGGLQFDVRTWRAMGGTGLPNEHSRAEQIRVAERLRDHNGGYGAWPACSRKLGLPR
jgi:resuscitation-promoting factor RpfB